jgi:hypothetical protein
MATAYYQLTANNALADRQSVSKNTMNHGKNQHPGFKYFVLITRNKKNIILLHPVTQITNYVTRCP